MIETPRLTLRGWRDDDRDWYAAACACPVVMAHLGGPKTRVEVDARVDLMMARHAAGEPAFWLVERKADGARIGDAGLKRVDAPGAPMQGALEIGWRLEYAFWGQGYAREAAAASLDHAFGQRGAPVVVALTTARNIASRDLMRHLGMIHRPDLDYRDARYGEEDNPTIVHVIAAGDWRAG